MSRPFATVHEYEAHQRRVKGAPARPPLTTCRFILPIPPALNHMGADGFRGGRKTPEYHAFMDAVARTVVEQGSPRIEGRLKVTIEIVPANGRRFDIDGRAKALLDALEDAGVYSNDEQIDHLEIRRYPCNIPGEGSCCVTVSRMGA